MFRKSVQLMVVLCLLSGVFSLSAEPIVFSDPDDYFDLPEAPEKRLEDESEIDFGSMANRDLTGGLNTRNTRYYRSRAANARMMEALLKNKKGGPGKGGNEKELSKRLQETGSSPNSKGIPQSGTNQTSGSFRFREESQNDAGAKALMEMVSPGENSEKKSRGFNSDNWFTRSLNDSGQENGSSRSPKFDYNAPYRSGGANSGYNPFEKKEGLTRPSPNSGGSDVFKPTESGSNPKANIPGNSGNLNSIPSRLPSTGNSTVNPGSAFRPPTPAPQAPPKFEPAPPVLTIPKRNF